MDWLEKAAAELDNLSRVLESEGVKVRRPDQLEYSQEQSVRLIIFNYISRFTD
jgi:hypothetical protein